MPFYRPTTDRTPLKTYRLLRVGVWTYVFALVLIAACTIGFHLLTDSMVGHQKMAATAVNLTGRQRMLAQRIVRLSIERAIHARFRTEAETERELRDAISTMEQGYAQIVQMRASRTANPINQTAVETVYTGPQWRLDEQTRSFLERAHALAARPCESLSLQDPDLVTAEVAVDGPLIDALNASVTAVEIGSGTTLEHVRRVNAFLTGSMLVLLLLEALVLFRPLFNRLSSSTEELVRVGATDPLTGSLNRRAFLEQAATVIRKEREAGRPVSIAMLDLDRFKAVNDQYGHSAGDAVINAVVAITLRHIRAGDLLCRMGGEEFALLLRGSTLETARIAAERIRAAVADSPITLDPSELGLRLQVTISIGVGMLCPEEETIFPVLSRADRALYRAKAAGRNRVEEEGFDVVQDLASDPVLPVC